MSEERIRADIVRLAKSLFNRGFVRKQTFCLLIDHFRSRPWTSGKDAPRVDIRPESSARPQFVFRVQAHAYSYAESRHAAGCTALFETATSCLNVQPIWLIGQLV